MSMILAPKSAAVKPAFVVLFAPARIVRSDRFGHGVFPTKPATIAEARRHFLESTFSAEEKLVADRFALTLEEARDVIAEGEEALRDLECERLAAWDACNVETGEAASFADELAGAVGPAPLAPSGPRVVIGGLAYAVESIPTAPECGDCAARLTKPDGTAYDVVYTPDGELACDCPDFTFKRQGTGQVCKHGAALVAAGMMPPTRPRLV